LAYSGTALRATISATSFTLVGVICKIFTILINVLMWDKHASPTGLFSLGFSLAGSTLYVNSGLRSSGDFSSRVWHGMDTLCCGFCSVVNLSAPKVQYSAIVDQESELAQVTTADASRTSTDVHKETEHKTNVENETLA